MRPGRPGTGSTGRRSRRGRDAGDRAGVDAEREGRQGEDRSQGRRAARAVSDRRVAAPGHGALDRRSRPRRELTRAHDACRRDLMNARHRVSKMLLRHGRVYPEAVDLDAGSTAAGWLPSSSASRCRRSRART